MDFKQIRAEFKDIEFDLIRVDSYNYFEAVILSEKLPSLSEKLEKIFSKPLFPSGKKLDNETREIIEDFGGVREGQTLYYVKDKEHSYFAMLWPWSDEYHITLKVGRK